MMEWKHTVGTCGKGQKLIDIYFLFKFEKHETQGMEYYTLT